MLPDLGLACHIFGTSGLIPYMKHSCLDVLMNVSIVVETNRNVRVTLIWKTPISLPSDHTSAPGPITDPPASHTQARFQVIFSSYKSCFNTSIVCGAHFPALCPHLPSRSEFPPGITLAELQSRSIARESLGSAPGVLNLLTQHLDSMFGSLNGLPGVPLLASRIVLTPPAPPPPRPTQVRPRPRPVPEPTPFQIAAIDTPVLLTAILEKIRRLRSLAPERWVWRGKW